MLSFGVCLFVCLCIADRSIRPANNIIEINNATDYKFGNHISWESQNDAVNIFFEKGCDCLKNYVADVSCTLTMSSSL